jgi:hypothetical protein
VRVAVITANLGGYEHAVDWPNLIAPDGVTVDVHRFTDENLPPRPLAMTSRLQAGIPKWWGWELVPGYDVYIWVDASCTLLPDGVAWFLERLPGKDIAVFLHPQRRTIQQEYEFMAARLARKGETYLNARYKGEWLREQYEFIAKDRLYADSRLYASTAFAYRATTGIKWAFQDIWSAKARFLLHDQLMFPYALWKRGCHVNELPDHYLQCPALKFVRTGKRRAA